VFLVRNAGNAVADCALLVASLALAFVFAAIQAPGVGDATFVGGASIDPAELANRVRPNAWLCGVIVIAGAGALYVGTFIKTGPRLSRAALALGGISYPLYLLHDSFGSIMIDLAPPGSIPLSILLAMSAVVAICYSVWRMEVPVRDHLMHAVRHSRLGLPKREITPALQDDLYKRMPQRLVSPKWPTPTGGDAEARWQGLPIWPSGRRRCRSRTGLPHHSQDLDHLRKRLAETVDKAERRIILKLLALNDVALLPTKVRRH
jgi:hypothetical protein